MTALLYDIGVVPIQKPSDLGRGYRNYQQQDRASIDQSREATLGSDYAVRMGLEFHLAATAQNLRKLAKLVPAMRPIPVA